MGTRAAVACGANCFHMPSRLLHRQLDAVILRRMATCTNLAFSREGQCGCCARWSPLRSCQCLALTAFTACQAFFLDSERDLWSPGQFASDPRVRLKRELGREGAPVHFVSGFFNESLQLGLGREFGMQPAKYVLFKTNGLTLRRRREGNFDVISPDSFSVKLSLLGMPENFLLLLDKALRQARSSPAQTRP